MFLPGLLPGGGLLVITTMLASAAAFIVLMWRRIPHPAEYECIGRPLRMTGIHKHLPYDLIFEIAFVKLSAMKTADYYITIECGRFDVSTQVTTLDVDGKANFFERLTIRLRQMDDHVKLTLFRRGVMGLSNTLVGTMQFNWEPDLAPDAFPRDKSYHWTKDGKRSVDTVVMSLMKVSALNQKPANAVDQLAVIEARKRGKDISSLDEVPPQERLQLYANCIEGPLEVLRPLKPPKAFYFKAQRLKSGKYSWMMYADREAAEAKTQHLDQVPLLSISLVLADPANRHQFYVKYLTKDGVKELFLKRIDRDRDLWSEGLYGFIEKYREVLHQSKTKKRKGDEEAEEAEASPQFSKAAWQMMLSADDDPSEDETTVLISK
ncbi:MAG: uncharacterized protein KVP18_001269 [Porospora cf. gigantea A]|uniref:uncharacterized protein n=2 Tax=Porospora cf. gigantea A TaxID=2853593 RepID=UPI00355970EB|nr:MAG: hypothetical protein KVP18_001269 [Porospora cf. gigantea A]